MTVSTVVSVSDNVTLVSVTRLVVYEGTIYTNYVHRRAGYLGT